MSVSKEQLEYVGLGIPYEDWTVGRQFRTVGRTITEADITLFVGVTGMTEVLFTDLEYLRENSLIGGRPAPGALVYSMAEGLLMQSVMQHTGLAFLGMDLKVESPVIAGNTIHVECEVIDARQTSKPGRGIVTARCDVIKENGERALTYTCQRLVKARSAAL